MFPFLYLCVHVGCKVNGIYLIVMTFCVCELMTKITIIRGGLLSIKHKHNHPG